MIERIITYCFSLEAKGMSWRISILILYCLLLVLSSFQVMEPDIAAQSPKELLLKIQTSKADTTRISLQLKLGEYYLFKPGELKIDLDSAFIFFNKALQLSIKLKEKDWQYKAKGMIGNYYVEAGDIERFKQSFMEVAAYYHQTGNKEKEAVAWLSLADLYVNTMTDAQMQDRLRYYKTSRSLFLQTNNQLNANHALCGMAGVQTDLKQFDQAVKVLEQVLAQYKKLGYKKLHFTYEMLEYLEYERGNYNKSVAYCLEAVKNMKANGDSSWPGFFYAKIAKSYVTTRKYEEALKWQKKAAAVKGTAFANKCGVVQIYLKLDRIQEAGIVLEKVLSQQAAATFDDTVYLYRIAALYYAKVNKYDTALSYYKKLLAFDLKKNYHSASIYNSVLLMIYTEMGDIYIKTGQLAEAGESLKNAELIVEDATTSLAPNILMNLYTTLYKYEAARGNYPAALKTLEKRDVLKDSLFTADKDKQIAELNVQYETSQKELSIKTLRSKQSAQQARVEKANQERNITVGGIILLLILSGLGYKAFRAKQRSNKQLLAKQEQINTQNATLQHLLTEKDWLLKEVHHRVKNNLHTVICLLEAQGRNLENDALEAIEKSQQRIYAMSLIHEKLYQSEDIKTIDMAEYIPELVESLNESFGNFKQINFKLHIDPVALTLSQAIPLGLILNEAVTNSIKYAFPDDKEGEVSISMMNEGNQITLEIVDDGIGMPTFDPEAEIDSMGLRLIKGLSENIDAAITFEAEHGTKITIVFKPDTLSDVYRFSQQAEERQLHSL